MTLLYRLLIRACLPLVFIYLWLRGRKAPAYRLRWRERLALQTIPANARQGLLIHCVSVGETVAAREFIEQVLARYPQLPVTLSSMTPTASELAQTLFADHVHHLYLPVDTPGAMRRFFDKLAPRVVVVLETEVWPGFLQQAQLHKVPVLLLNARMSEKSQQTYLKYSWLTGPIWQQLTWVAAQNHTSAERFMHLGVASDRIAVRGNLKFDSHVPVDLLARATALKQQLQRPIVLAASTHQGEDELVLKAFTELLDNVPNALLILVPRHPERFAAVAEKVAGKGLSYVRRSAAESPEANNQVWLGDTMGELVFWYAAADVAFVGGSLIKRGGHNPLEPIATHTPVVSGPHVFNFQEIYQRLDGVGGVRWAADADELALQWLDLLNDANLRFTMQRAAVSEFAQDQGATAAMLSDLHQHMMHQVPTCNNVTGSTATELPSMKKVTTLKPQGNVEIWYDGEHFDDFSDDYFTADYWRRQDKIKGSATGRSTAWFIAAGEQGMLLRHYYRGGLVGKVNKDRFAREAIANSRAMAEFELLMRLRERQLPVPKPLAARYEKAPVWGYRADILVEIIPQAEDLFKLLGQRQLTAQQWREVGGVIRQFHDAGVYHSDLNCHNIMLDAAGKVWLVDFDKCGFRDAGEWQQANLARLLRSLHKEAAKAKEAKRDFHWQKERDWPLLTKGYQGKS
ncbi:lipid IV(A) 3-deoxy-D-manno-octulosonic acid transferase [Pseudidiomarina halophila]|uniref:3-deoxy-D-manno-octulosonic acid kinase n=1 Tax=Pseudidiomarina halophila TaxID=1449799 RepID=A0A432Y1V8_9GAMM|nr:lipid IV(A) 3-deoxy-D-manno-octulosonic acid transferase [Pseudidiomarina halophila]RUO54925.1 3-deoxy-D-manno-octulosonic acid transferase [Pseudidiomarina halophila]